MIQDAYSVTILIMLVSISLKEKFASQRQMDFESMSFKCHMKKLPNIIVGQDTRRVEDQIINVFETLSICMLWKSV